MNAYESKSTRSADATVRTHSPSTPETLGLKALILDGQELFITLLCAECGKPILDPSDANVMIAGAEAELGDPMIVDGYVVQPLGGRVIAKHKRHDEGGERPWVPANLVLRADQRGLRDRAARFMTNDQNEE